MSNKNQTYCQENNLELVKSKLADCPYFNNQMCHGCNFIKNVVEARKDRVKIEFDTEY